MTVASSSGSSSRSSSHDSLAHHRALLARVASRRQRRSTVVPTSDRPVPTPSADGSGLGVGGEGPDPSPPVADEVDLTAVPPTKRAKVETLYPCYRWDEETVRNDLPARYGLTGEWGGSFIAGADEARRFDEYPRSKRLLRLKKEVLARLAHPPLFLPLAPLEQDDEPAIAPDVPVPAKASPNALSTASLPALPGSRQAHSDVPPVLRPFNAHLLAALGQTRFDTVVVTPPAGLSWAEIAALPIRQLTADPAFVYLWVGEGGADGLEKGREALARWGFRRCEEIVWVKTNKATAKGFGKDAATGSVFANTKEHCLMGIRGTVRRSVDGRLVHTNIDTDIIVWEVNPEDPHVKPPELFSLAENFSMGTRRLDMFGSRTRPRQGWVIADWALPASTAPAASINSGAGQVEAGGTSAVDRLESIAAAEELRVPAGEDPAPAADGVCLFDKDAYEALVRIDGRYLYPTPDDVENLRPKSPVRNGSSGPSRPHSSQYVSGGSNGGGSSSGHRPYVPIAVSSVPGFSSLPLPPRPMGASGGGMQLAQQSQQQQRPSQQQQQQQRRPPPPPQQQQHLNLAFGNNGVAVNAFPTSMAAMGGMLPFAGAYGLPMAMPMGPFFQSVPFGMGMTPPQAGMMNQTGMQGMYAAAYGGGMQQQQQQSYRPGPTTGMMLPPTSMPHAAAAASSTDLDDDGSSSSSSSPPPPSSAAPSVAYSYSYDRLSNGWGGPR